MMATQTQAQSQVSLTKFALYFLKLGCIGFGGPIALVGYMQKDLVEERKQVVEADGRTIEGSKIESSHGISSLLSEMRFGPPEWARPVALRSLLGLRDQHVGIGPDARKRG